MEAKAPLLVFADDWGRHPSSCQHLVRRLRQSRPVLWVNSIGTRQVKVDALSFRRGAEKLQNWSRGLHQVDRQMWVLDAPMLPGFGSQLLKNVNRSLVTGRIRTVLSRLGLARPVVLTTLPYTYWLIRDLPRRALIYYCTDDFSHWPSADRASLQSADQVMSARADLILAASQALLRSHEYTGRAEYFPHGVDVEHFGSASLQPVPACLASLPRPRIGYFGLLYEKLDYPLLSRIAERFTNGSLVLIGPKAFCPEGFDSRPNIHLLGARDYADLPRHLGALDALLMPYLDDPMIRQSGPLKLRECLATGKPTVSIDIPDTRRMIPHVRVASTQEGFVHELEMALKEPTESPAILSRQRAVENDGWDRRAARLEAAIANLSSAKRHRNNGIRVSGSDRGRRRILHLRTVCGKGGGPEKTLLNSPRFLRDGYDVRLAYLRPEGDPDYDMPARAREMGVELMDIPERGPVDSRSLRQLCREIRAFRPEILHAHDYKTNVLAYLLGRWFRIPVMTTVHGYVERGGILEAYYLMDRWALHRMDHVIAVSADLFSLLAKLRIPASKRSLIENAIDTTAYVRQGTSVLEKQRLGLNSELLAVGAVGRLAPEKGFDLLIQGVDLLYRAGLNFELLIVGEGPEKERLQSLADRTLRPDRIHLLGHRSDMSRVYQSMDLFVLSSLREGLPNVLLEAMALEVPVVATRVAGVPRLIADGQNGLLVDSGSAHGLAQAIRRLLQDETLRHVLGKAGRARVEECHSFEIRMSKVRAIYDNLLSRA